MMKNILILSLIFAVNAQAGLTSNFASTVDGLSIPNSHTLTTDDSEQALVIRGMAPNFEQIAELREIGVQKVIIFKNETKNEVRSEITNLIDAGFEKKNITHIPFPWKDLHNFQEACKMTVNALKIIVDSEKKQTPLFFHCTVGEDRTGYLAGLHNIWKNPEADVEQIFKQELCTRGYESGNSKKPATVVNKIRETLTPTFIKMAQLLKQWQAEEISLSADQCPTDIEMLTQNMKCERTQK